ncbi:MAG: prolyl-tRNA synthetase associated domain-containing protein [Candidatus Dadabacteria bacterium]|nr:MAG: prolyl-tRNA synthetase associated domain-containing protein [Candidatus Dadabacteria bacterium]
MDYKLNSILDKLGIDYELFSHPPVFTCEEADKYCAGISGARTKNLFLRDKNGKRHLLVTTKSTRKVSLADIEKLSGAKHLSFASEKRLMDHLGVKPGAVSPLGLVNDSSGQVEVYIDSTLLKSERILLHPNDNTATVIISSGDFVKFLKSRKNPFSVF